PGSDRHHLPVGRRHAGCGVVSNDCSDASAANAAISESSAAPLPPPKPAIACASWATSLEPPMDALDAVGGSTAKPPSCQSNPTAPKPAADVIMLLAMS